jgi:hypothetical protein
MSDVPPPSPPPPQRNGCLTGFLVVTGIILLLPGLCTIIFFHGSLGDREIVGITQITFGVGFIGLILILVAVARR